MTDDLVKKTADYVRIKLHHEPSGHDWLHIARVWRIAKFLQKKEGGNLQLIELAALLHNLKEHHCDLCHNKKANLAMTGMMEVIGIGKTMQKRIIELTNDSKYKAGQTNRPKTVEGKIIQDANWLDAMGAIGIARAFASGGYLNRPIHDPNVKVRENLTNKEYLQKRQTTSFNYLYEKALRLPDFMNTKTARRIARRRKNVILRFINDFNKEFNSEDLKE